MFDLIVTGHRKTPHGDTVPIMLSLSLHSVAAVTVVIVSLLWVTDSVPQTPTMMAFVAAAAPPPPPPPPAPRIKTEPRNPQPASPTHAPGEMVAPSEAPTMLPANSGTDGEEELGVPGGVEGGIAGGVVGGVVADIPSPAPPPAPTTPVRIGGELRPPALVSRVEPIYPEFAVRAHVEGVVILEAIVGVDGCVEDVRILRSIQLLNQAAIDAVRQWRYAPLLLNGNPVRFILTVTVAFHITEKS